MKEFGEHALVPVPFHEDTVFIVPHEGEPFVPLKPICQNLGLNWKTQHRKIADSHLASTIHHMTTVAADGKVRKMASIMLRKFPGWLYSISPSKVKATIREKLEAYQKECDDVLWNYWTGGKDQDEKLRQIIREELAHFKPVRTAAMPVTADEKATMLEMKQDNLQTAAIAAKLGRSKSTVRKHIAAFRQLGMFAGATA